MIDIDNRLKDEKIKINEKIGEPNINNEPWLLYYVLKKEEDEWAENIKKIMLTLGILTFPTRAQFKKTNNMNLYYSINCRCGIELFREMFYTEYI